MIEVRLQSRLGEIGKLLRLFREKTGRSLADVAAGSGISTSMLSQIERAVVSPSIDTLFGVCAALNLDVSELFSRLSPKSPVRVIHPANRLRTQDGGVRYEQLVTSPDPAYPAEMFLLEVGPGKEIGLSGHGHEGAEMGYVLGGRAVMTVENVQYPLTEGDSISFTSHLPHRLANNGDSVFRAVWTVMPPHKDYLDMGTNSTEEESSGKNNRREDL